MKNSVLANRYLSTCKNPGEAYLRLQSVLFRRYVAMGGSVDAWMNSIRFDYRRKFGWMVEQHSQNN